MKKHILSFFIFLIITSSFYRAQSQVLYGVTQDSGLYQNGAIFSYNVSTGIETVVYNFKGAPNDGAFPLGSLIQASNGVLYGMTYAGGTTDSGTIYSYNICTGTETVLHNFGIGTDGRSPNGSLMQATNGLLYGDTYTGGIYNEGAIFSYDITTGVETKLHDFGSGTDGQQPLGTLIQASNGLLYGTTYWGGSNLYFGTLFSYNISLGTETDLHDFGSSGTDGAYVGPSVTQAANGLLYGGTEAGGTNGYGIIFSYDITNSTETPVFSFDYYDGDMPYGCFIKASNGLLYGLTGAGGSGLRGTIYSYNTSNNTPTTDLYDFANGIGGSQPCTSLIQSSNGLLYGTTAFDGAYEGGTIYSYDITTGIETKLHDFGNGADGSRPWGSLLEVDSSGGSLALSPKSPEICSGASVTLYVTGGSNYTWSPATGLSATTGDSVIASPTVTTVYQVTGAGSCASTATDTVKIIAAMPLSVIPPSSTICSGRSVTLMVEGGGTNFVWSPATGLSATTGDSVIANPTAATTYYVTGTDSLGCTSSGTDTINIIPAPNKPTITISVTGDSLTSSASSYNQWFFNGILIPDSTRQVLVIKSHARGWFSVTVTNPANGCTTNSDSTTSVDQLPGNNYQSLIYPNPTSGQFTIKLKGNETNSTIEVYNILGEQIYRSIIKSPQTDIDLGTQPQGMYFVYLKTEKNVEVKKIQVIK